MTVTRKIECRVCGSELNESVYTRKQWNYKKNFLKKKGYTYCSKECSQKILSENSSKVMAITNRKYASERMKKNNPMFRKEVREKVSKKAKGRPLAKRGGNGSGMTKPQKKLLEELSHLNPVPEMVIKTNKPMSSKYPGHYKIDIALPDKKLAIEVDGKSHYSHSRKLQDEKKDDFMRSIGWEIIHIKNEEVNEDLEGSLKKIGDLVAN